MNEYPQNPAAVSLLKKPRKIKVSDEQMDIIRMAIKLAGSEIKLCRELLINPATIYTWKTHRSSPRLSMLIKLKEYIKRMENA